MRLSLSDYLEDCWSKASTYVKGVESGSIKTSKWIKLAVQRHVEDVANEDLWDYRVDAVERVFKFFYFLNINIANKYSQFQLLPYQAFMLVALFGLYKKGTNKRKYRYAFLFMARKNGKTAFAAALQLYFVLADGVQDPQSLLVASTREQASIALESATNIIHNSPAISKRLDAQRYKIIFKDRSKGGFSKTLASNATRLDGYGASSCILDEIHAYPDDSLFNVIKSSILARTNPMVMLISTAGFNISGLCFDLVETGKNTLMKEIENPSFFFMLYMLDDKDDYEDTDNWVKSNPSLDEVVFLEDLLTEFQHAVNMPSELNNFLTKHLNLFVAQSDIWIPDEKVKELVNPDIKIEDYAGKDCFIGMDLSSTRDLASIVVLFFDEELNKHVVFPYFFMPDNQSKSLRKGGYSIDLWVKKGYINKSMTPTTDYNAIFHLIEKISNEHNIIKVMYDKWNAASLINKIQQELEYAYCESFEQTTTKFNRPLKHLETLIYNEDIILAENPVLRWNFRNAVLYQDGNNNIKLMKNKSLDSIDGLVSLGMAMGGYLETYMRVE